MATMTEYHKGGLDNSLSLLGPGAQQVEERLGELISGGLTPEALTRTRGTPLGEDYFSSIENFLARDEALLLAQSQAIQDLMAGTPAFSMDYQALEEYYNTNVARPAFDMFRKYAQPIIEEQYAGSFQGSSRARGVSRETGKFAAGVSKGYFDMAQQGLGLEAQSRELAASRIPGAVQMSAQLPYLQLTQRTGASQLAQQGRDFNIRNQMPTANPFFQAGLGFAATPTQENIVREEEPGFDPTSLLPLIPLLFGGPAGIAAGAANTAMFSAGSR